MRAQAALFGLLLVFGLAACGGRTESPEARVRAWLKAGEAAAEARRLMALKEMISAGYRDEAGRNRRAVVRVLMGYFHRHGSIYLLMRVEDISFPEPGRAQVLLYAAMAAEPIAGAESLTDMRADLHRFELDLVDEEGEWKLLSAAWRRAAPQDLIPLGREKVSGLFLVPCGASKINLTPFLGHLFSPFPAKFHA